MAMQHNIDQTKKNKISNFKVFIKTIRRIMSYIGRTDKIYIRRYIETFVRNRIK